MIRLKTDEGGGESDDRGANRFSLSFVFKTWSRGGVILFDGAEPFERLATGSCRFSLGDSFRLRVLLYFCTVKVIYIFLGGLSLGLGVAGIFLPLLPTTPFLLLSAALWLRSSPRLYHWLLNHKRLGPYIRDFLEHKAIPLRVKIISVSLVWITLLYCALFVARGWWLALLFILLAVALSWHILSYKTRR